ncbi:MAG TPA: peptidylprolyl isomerase [Candidatus Acidoferrales bacterium]|nr:peptidylprolyl isomerase [Candidatus Acidoferrales bacterium]
MKRTHLAVLITSLAFLLPAMASASGTVVEEIIARVNNDVITLSDYKKAEAGLPEQIQQECQGCAPDKVAAMLADEKKNLLRSLIDSSLLVQRAKDLDITVETDLVKQLDQIRQQNKLASMEELQKAVESSGMGWEDYKEQMRDSLLTQRVIQQDVGSTVKISNEDVQSYYNAHKTEFVKPEEVDISEIFFSTQGKTPDEVAAIQQKADVVLKRLNAGEDFGGLARRNSEGPTASDGGELGLHKRGELAPELENAVFSLHKGDSTGIIHTASGLDILHVNEHYDAGLQPLDKVEMDIENHLYQQRVQPAMRQYLDKLRRDSYVVVKAGYTDTGSVGGSFVIKELSASNGQEKASKKKPSAKEQ